MGTDVSEQLGITLYEPPCKATMGGTPKGTFPTNLVSKTDQERIQNCLYDVRTQLDQLYEVSLKYDGTSFTCFRWENEFRVCSRNLELKETEDNIYWQIAKKYDLQNLVPNGYAIQGEICGPGIQGNPHRLGDKQLFIFEVQRIPCLKLTPMDRSFFLQRLGLFNLQARIFGTLSALVNIGTLSALVNIDDYLNLVKALAGDLEGLVFKSVYNDFSFKAISPDYLLKNQD